ncbi:glycosyltransferase [Sphingomonas sp.]|uniref:glycosyltransferase n=1 Tax=Sphingomonas sp. TaxID=28214 RepID=UPI003AFFD75A
MIRDRLLDSHARAARKDADRARDERRWADAASGYRRWLVRHPDDFAIWVQLGHMLREQGTPAEADRAYATAATLRADDGDLLLYWGHCRRILGDADGALALYRRSAATDDNADARREIEAVEREEAAQAAPEEPQPQPEPEQPEPEPEPAEEARPFVGRIEYLYREVVHGWLADGGDDDRARIDFVDEDDRAIGRAWANAGVRREDGYEFRALLDLDRPVRVHARRASDGAELEGSPFETRPRERAVDERRRAWDARVEIVKPLRFEAGGEIALYVTHSATGALKPHVARTLRLLIAEGVQVLLIAATERPLDLPSELLALAAGVIVRENVGYDFAAWAHALHLLPELWSAGTLILANDSVVAADARIAPLIADVRASVADAVALTASLEYRWHAQSYFLALKPAALSSFSLQRFFREVRIAEDKNAVIRDYEVPLAGEIEGAGLRLDILYPAQAAFNPMLRGWRELVDRGFPFVKVLLLAGAFPDVNVEGWRTTLARAGFDVPLIEAVVGHGREPIPRDGDDRLYAHPLPRVADAATLKVAFYGPWNYDNGLGSASRGLIAALRRTGVRLNLHPVRKRFHIHRPIAPAVDVRDFEGDADIAVVHLNPDSWHLLDEEQLDEIGRARRRIGYWVWEMDHIPGAWWHRFGAVDRIWAPSRYCARLFSGQDGPPVDVVPHVVPLPPAPARSRADILGALELNPARRVILYVFDGSSYLVRKNPAALVRAFAASGLAERGWTLALKVKHLYDRREDGEAFAAFVAGEREVALLNHRMLADDLDALVAAADIYASPHASEGFGLTIAEAMAAGKPVVATDFGGSADILDATTGYPVRWHDWVLDRDYGHYTAGGRWARIDEPALSAALVAAADAVEACDDRVGEAARARVAERLSAEAVAAAIARSFAALETERFAARTFEPLPFNLVAGVPLERGSGDDRVRLMALAADGDVPDDFTSDAGDAEWIALAPAGSLASPLLATRLLAAVAARLDVQLFYADDVAVRTERPREQIRRKPEFDATLLAAQDYVGAPLFVRADAWRELGGLDAARGTAAVADLLFRAHASGRSIARIPEVLLAHPGERVLAMPEDYRAMLRTQPRLAAFDIADGAALGSFLLRRRFAPGAEPPVTILIPTRRATVPGTDVPAIERLLASLGATNWPADKLRIVVGDDREEEPDWARAPYPFALTRVATPRAADEPFNYAAKMNRLWRMAQTEQIVFLNDDVHGMAPGWLRGLQTFAVDGQVGGVGARLLFDDGSLQHAGLAPHGTCVAHAWVGHRRERGSYFDWASVHREWSMVTGAVFATRRSLMELVGGFDERFAVEFNDTDLCLRLRALGYRIVCTPDAEMIHTEKASRGEAPPRGDTIARFLARWSGWIAADPAWHPLLSRDRFEAMPIREDDAWYV